MKISNLFKFREGNHPEAVKPVSRSFGRSPLGHYQNGSRARYRDGYCVPVSKSARTDDASAT